MSSDRVDRGGSQIGVRTGEGPATSAYVAAPPSGRGPAVVVVHDEWGMSDFARDVCDRLARAGFVALAPDWLDGAAAHEPEQAAQLAKSLDAERAGAVLDGAVVEALSQDAAVGRTVGVLGFGAGGALGWSLAARAERVGAVASCDADPGAVGVDFAALRAPLFAVFAADDPRVDGQALERLGRALRDAGVRHSVRSREGAARGFMNDSRPDVHDAVAEFETWDALLAFFRAELP